MELEDGELASMVIIKLPSVEHEVATNENIEIPTYENTEVEVKDEYNTDEIIKAIKEK